MLALRACEGEAASAGHVGIGLTCRLESIIGHSAYLAAPRYPSCRLVVGRGLRCAAARTLLLYASPLTDPAPATRLPSFFLFPHLLHSLQTLSAFQPCSHLPNRPLPLHKTGPTFLSSSQIQNITGLFSTCKATSTPSVYRGTRGSTRVSLKTHPAQEDLGLGQEWRWTGSGGGICCRSESGKTEI